MSKYDNYNVETIANNLVYNTKLDINLFNDLIQDKYDLNKLANLLPPLKDFEDISLLINNGYKITKLDLKNIFWFATDIRIIDLLITNDNINDIKILDYAFSAPYINNDDIIIELIKRGAKVAILDIDPDTIYGSKIHRLLQNKS